jgi:hypothetical protein
MRTIMVRYKTKPEMAEANENLVKKVFHDLQRDAPAGVRYATFKLADGVSFVHIASIDTADGRNPIVESAAFQAFQADIKDRLLEPPVTSELTAVGSYNLFG